MNKPTKAELERRIQDLENEMKSLHAANPDACVQYLIDCASALVAAAAVVVNMRNRTPEQDHDVIFTVVK